MSCAEHKKSTATRDISQAEAAKDAFSANDGAQKIRRWQRQLSMFCASASVLMKALS